MKKLVIAFALYVSVFTLQAQVKHSGAMSEMGKTGFAPTIYLDSLQQYKQLIGLGPLGRMEGEITIVDGMIYGGKSLVSGETIIAKDFHVQAPFLVYCDVDQWQNVRLSGSAESLSELEKKIMEAAISSGINLEEPFFFRIEGTFDQMVTHIVTPRSPEIEGYIAGQNQKNFDHLKESGELIGVYSKVGQRIYTHHNSYMHVHFLNSKKDFTGHLDMFQSKLDQLVIYFPKESGTSK